MWARRNVRAHVVAAERRRDDVIDARVLQADDNALGRLSLVGRVDVPTADPAGRTVLVEESLLGQARLVIQAELPSALTVIGAGFTAEEAGVLTPAGRGAEALLVGGEALDAEVGATLPAVALDGESDILRVPRVHPLPFAATFQVASVLPRAIAASRAELRPQSLLVAPRTRMRLG